MARQIALTEMGKDRQYRVVGFSVEANGYTETLEKMGFVEGTPVTLAPVLLTDPLVIQIRGSRIALRRDEARVVVVEEVSHA